MRGVPLVILGAIVGGLVGYVAFAWGVRQGFYALAIPGGLLGVGAGCFHHRSIAVCVLCGIAAGLLGLFAEWRFAPFLDDASLTYFLTHVHQLRPMTWIMIIVGGLIGFWSPYSKYHRTVGTERTTEYTEYTEKGMP